MIPGRTPLVTATLHELSNLTKHPQTSSCCSVSTKCPRHTLLSHFITPEVVDMEGHSPPRVITSHTTDSKHLIPLSFSKYSCSDHALTWFNTEPRSFAKLQLCIVCWIHTSFNSFAKTLPVLQMHTKQENSCSVMVSGQLWSRLIPSQTYWTWQRKSRQVFGISIKYFHSVMETGQENPSILNCKPPFLVPP